VFEYTPGISVVGAELSLGECYLFST
jgi:hypothetical protein